MRFDCTFPPMNKSNKSAYYVKYFEFALLALLVYGLIKFCFSIDFVKNLKSGEKLDKSFIIGGTVIMAFIVLTIHELGHLLAGLWQGFRFELFVVGPLGIKREDEKVKIYLNKNLGYYGGVAATSPRDNSSDNGKKFARLIIAGPLTSLVFALICFLLAYWLDKPWGAVFFAGSMISAAIFLVTTVPSSTGMFFTDRKRYQRLITPGKEQDVELAMLHIMGSYAKNDSYKQINIKDIKTLMADDFPFFSFYGHFNLVCYQLEINGFVEEAVLEEYKAKSAVVSKSLSNAFNLEIEKFKQKLGLV